MDFMTFVRAERDRVAGGLLILIGAIIVIAGYVGVANSKYVADQLAYIISGGVGGLFLLGVGATLFVMADLRDEWSKLDRIEVAIREAGALAPVTAPAVHQGYGQEPPTAEIPAVLVGAAVNAQRAPARRRRTAPAGALPASNGAHVGAVTMQVDEARAQAARALGGAAAGGRRQPLRVAAPAGAGGAGGAVMRTSGGIAGAGMATALVLLLFAEHHAATVSQVQPAIDATSVAIGALVICAVSSALGLLYFRRSAALRTTRLLARWDPKVRPQTWSGLFTGARDAAALEFAGASAPSSAGAMHATGTPGQPLRLVTSPTLSRVHVLGCPVTRNVADLSDVAAGQVPAGTLLCGLCGADQQ